MAYSEKHRYVTYSGSGTQEKYGLGRWPLARGHEGVIIFINETCGGGFGLCADWPDLELGHPAPVVWQAVAVHHRLPRLRRRLRQNRVQINVTGDRWQVTRPASVFRGFLPFSCHVSLVTCHLHFCGTGNLCCMADSICAQVKFEALLFPAATPVAFAVETDVP